ncbi:MAG: hypothetical protein MRERC_14c006 [Mycoplasmataceae bacterium RC_NB112A]|nr:MAG: hypothetical protein MRERC_14c006 [Mycoplasmataceae bacterium RC_NB112A]
MNDKKEIKKIKVDSSQELIAKAKEYKNSGGEWKLLERHWTLPSKEKTDVEKGWSKRNNLEAIKISNGQQEIDISLEDQREIINFLSDDWEKIKALFPEISRSCVGSEEVPYSIPGKEVKNEKQESIFLSRMLNAWSVTDILKIIADYCKENQTEIKNDNSELEKYRNFIQNLPSHSISLGNLQQQNNSNTSQNNSPNNNKLVIGLISGAGVVILLGAIVYFWKNFRQKKA